MSTKKRVLFVCIGNACRSQMAHGFARIHGADVMEIDSAGLAPASGIPQETRNVMDEKSISLETHFPKSIEEFNLLEFDYVINMSGVELMGFDHVQILTWPIDDPYGPDIERHRAARDRIEELIQLLILDLQNGRTPAQPDPPAASAKRSGLWRKLFR